MDKEILIEEFLDRITETFSAEAEPCECSDAISDATVNTEFDRVAARAALDRLFADLRDFTKEQK